MTPTLFALHALGSDRHEFDGIADRLRATVHVVGIDLPGFGDEPASAGTSVEEMVLAVERRIGLSGATDWALLGHSMGGKIASIVASRTLDGSNGLFGLRGVVLVAASPLSPEPMDDSRRQSMLAWAADGPIGEQDALAFVDANTVGTLPAPVLEAAVATVRKVDPVAWRAWLESGSREDWSDLPAVPAPALVLAGAADGDLGPEAQQRLTVPHWPNAEFGVVQDAAHLIPLEQPDALAGLIRDFWDRRIATAPTVPTADARVIASPRVSARTRGVLARRALPDSPNREGRVLSATQLHTLRAVAGIVVPQDGPAVDLALRVDAQLAEGTGDGWRPDGQPSDVEAYRAALDVLAPAAAQGADALEGALTAIRKGDAGDGPVLSAAQLRAWEEDLAVDLVKQWLAHPATMAAIDYDGYANGGDGVRKQGFRLLGAGQREPWEAERTAR